MQARFPGTCRDCGNKFPAGTDIDWQKGKGASCCNGSPQVAPQASKSPMVVNGAQRMEWVDGKTTQEVVGFQGDSLVYEQKEYSGYSWMCLGCRLVWERQHQAVNCESRGHVASFEQSYGGTVWDGRGFTPHGLVAGKYLPGTGTVYVRTAIRREKSKDTPPVAPVMEPYGRFPIEDYSHNPGCDGSCQMVQIPGGHANGCTNGPVPQVEEPAPQVADYDPKADAQKPWSQIVEEREIRACRLCTSLIANHRAYGRMPNFRDLTLCECCEEKPAPQADMTSEEMWESMPSVTHPTITTTWN